MTGIGGKGKGAKKLKQLFHFGKVWRDLRTQISTVSEIIVQVQEMPLGGTLALSATGGK